MNMLLYGRTKLKLINMINNKTRKTIAKREIETEEAILGLIVVEVAKLISKVVDFQSLIICKVTLIKP